MARPSRGNAQGLGAKLSKQQHKLLSYSSSRSERAADRRRERTRASSTRRSALPPVAALATASTSRAAAPLRSRAERRSASAWGTASASSKRFSSSRVAPANAAAEAMRPRTSCGWARTKVTATGRWHFQHTAARRFTALLQPAQGSLASARRALRPSQPTARKTTVANTPSATTTATT